MTLVLNPVALVARQGNTALTWETLLEGNSLPYMAMLRNLRNMLKTGISERFASMVVAKVRTYHPVRCASALPFGVADVRFERSFAAAVDPVDRAVWVPRFSLSGK